MFVKELDLKKSVCKQCGHVDLSDPLLSSLDILKATDLDLTHVIGGDDHLDQSTPGKIDLRRSFLICRISNVTSLPVMVLDSVLIYQIKMIKFD